MWPTLETKTDIALKPLLSGFRCTTSLPILLQHTQTRPSPGTRLHAGKMDWSVKCNARVSSFFLCHWHVQIYRHTDNTAVIETDAGAFPINLARKISSMENALINALTPVLSHVWTVTYSYSVNSSSLSVPAGFTALLCIKACMFVSIMKACRYILYIHTHILHKGSTCFCACCHAHGCYSWTPLSHYNDKCDSRLFQIDLLCIVLV